MTRKDRGHQAYSPADLFDFQASINILLKYYFLFFLNNLKSPVQISDHISAQNYHIAFQFSFAFVNSRCSSLSYRMDSIKRETKFNVPLNRKFLP